MDIHSLRIGTVVTSHGDLHFVSSNDPTASDRPIVFMVHGALRQAEHLAAWVPLLADEYDVMLCDLPGHGRDVAEDRPTVDSYVRRLFEAISFFDRPSVVIGESLGGLFAMGVAQSAEGPMRAVLAADPPLSTGKQWCVRLNLMALTTPPTPYQKFLLAQMLAMDGETVTGDRLYYRLIENAAKPTIIMAGSLPLFPVQPELPAPSEIPSVIDDVDRAFIAQIGNDLVSITHVPGAGHICLDTQFPDAVRIVTNFCREHLA